MSWETIEFEGYIDFGADKMNMRREPNYWEVYMFKPVRGKFSAMTPEEALQLIADCEGPCPDEVFDEEIVKNFEQVRAAGFLGDCVYFYGSRAANQGDGPEEVPF